MATTANAPKRAKTPAPTPLRDVVAGNLRAIMAREQVKATDLAERLGRPRQWVHRRTAPDGPITTEDIDALAVALKVSTDEITRRPSA